MLICLIASGGNLHDLVVSARFLCYQVIISHYVIHKYLEVGEILGD